MTKDRGAGFRESPFLSVRGQPGGVRAEGGLAGLLSIALELQYAQNQGPRAKDDWCRASDCGDVSVVTWVGDDEAGKGSSAD